MVEARASILAACRQRVCDGLASPTIATATRMAGVTVVISNLMFALLAYSDQHGGWFPKGEATPETSLSLLHRENPRGESRPTYCGAKTVPEATVRARLEAGELLTPETCGWHYVEGLRRGDDPRLALFWDKAGLGHNGERLSNGGHYVCFISMSFEYVPGDQWETFLAEQETAAR